MTARMLITGASGFVGNVLTPKLQSAGYHVTALGYQTPVPTADRSLLCDLCQAEAVAAAVSQAQPTHVIHLAAVSHVPTSFAEPLKTWQTNVMASLNLLEALRQHAPQAFILFASSSEVYGASFKQGEALDEQAPCQPMNPYSASKLAAECAFSEYFRQGMRGVIARPFNHIGAGQSASFVTSSFARQIALIEAGKQPPVLDVGNLQASRDFLDVRDVCDAYIRLLDLAQATTYPRLFNIASGVPRQIDSMLNSLLALSDHDIQVRLDPQRLRPSDIPQAIGNGRLLHEITAWKPAIAIEQTLRELLDYWRQQVRSHE